MARLRFLCPYDVPRAAGWILAVAAALGLACGFPVASGTEKVSVADLGRPDRLLVGVGDRLSMHLATRSIDLVALAREAEIPVDLFQIWLPRGWHESWIPPERLEGLAAQGSVPVIVHYFFGDGISRERVVAERREWHRSLARMARAIDLDVPVLVVLEPEWNDAPSSGQTPIPSWPGFARELSQAAAIVRAAAPNALVGTCVGDFSPSRNFANVLAPVAHELDFLAFQEMRAATESTAFRSGYLDLGPAAVDYARYLHERFDRPILLAYVAVSSYGDWEDRQASAIASLARHRRTLHEQGVFGVLYFQVRDDPDHTGYFGPAERHFGLIDLHDRPKPAAARLSEVARPFERAARGERVRGQGRPRDSRMPQ